MHGVSINELRCVSHLHLQGYEHLFTCHLYLCAQHWAYTIFFFFSFQILVVTPLGASQEKFNNKWQPFL